MYFAKVVLYSISQIFELPNRPQESSRSANIEDSINIVLGIGNIWSYAWGAVAYYKQLRQIRQEMGKAVYHTHSDGNWGEGVLERIAQSQPNAATLLYVVSIDQFSARNSELEDIPIVVR